MPQVSVLYWRDIPAQVVVGGSRRGAKVELPDRFDRAIGRCAMKVGAKDTDEYLAQWRKVSEGEVEGDAAEIASAVAARIDSEYDIVRLRALIDNEGHAPAG